MNITTGTYQYDPWIRQWDCQPGKFYLNTAGSLTLDNEQEDLPQRVISRSGPMSTGGITTILNKVASKYELRNMISVAMGAGMTRYARHLYMKGI